MLAQTQPARLALFPNWARVLVLTLLALLSASANVPNIPKMPQVGGDDVQSGRVDRTILHAYDAQGRLRALSTPEGTLCYGVDNLGAITNISARYGYPWPAPMPADGYVYDATFESQRFLSAPDGAEWTYAYDARGRLQRVNPDAQTADAAYTYDAVGNLAALTFRNGVSNTYTYNERNWLRLVDSRRGGTQVALFDYDGAAPGATGWTGRRLSAVGQRQRVAEVIGSTSRTVEYTYDPLRRLTQESITASAGPTGAVCYAQVTTNSTTQGYDWVGNRQSRKVTGASLMAAGVTDYEGNTFDTRDRLQTGALYDANGNTTNYTVASQATNYVYDAENRLIRQSSAAGDVTITYDADGNRVSKTVGTTTTFYLVETLNPSGYAQVMEERSALTGDPTVTYVYGLALISRSTINPQLSTVFYGTDGLGSARYLTDASGAVTETYTYDAFGIQLASTGTNVNNYRYTGQQWDPDLGMYYLRARYYRPELGRFWTMDSYEGSQGDPLSLHKYLYCRNNPANRRDPSGNEDLASLTISMGQQLSIASRYTLQVMKGYQKAKTILGFIQEWSEFVSAWRTGGIQTALKTAIKDALSSWKDIGIETIMQDLAENMEARVIPSVLAHWPAKLALTGQMPDAIGIDMPVPVPMTKTPVSIGSIPGVRVKAYFLFGAGGSKWGRVTGVEVRQKDKWLQIWRMDYHDDHDSQGDFDYWPSRNGLFHYHVLD